MCSWDFLGSPVVDSTLPVQGEKVRSLVGELRSRLLHGEAKKKTEREREMCSFLQGP